MLCSIPSSHLFVGTVGRRVCEARTKEDQETCPSPWTWRRQWWWGYVRFVRGKSHWIALHANGFCGWLHQFPLFSIPGKSVSKIPLNISQWNHQRGGWSASSHVVRLGVISYDVMMLMLHAMFRVWMGRFIGIHTTRVSIFKLGQIFALFPYLPQ